MGVMIYINIVGCNTLFKRLVGGWNFAKGLIFRIGKAILNWLSILHQSVSICMTTKFG
jgi:hypothetical protein